MREQDVFTDRVISYGRKLEGVRPHLLVDGLNIIHNVRAFHRSGDRYMEQYGLSARRFTILEALFHHPEQVMTPAELADHVGLTRTTMTTNLDGLERKKYIKRTQHPDDRRRVCVTLTASGRKFMERTLPRVYKNVERMTEILTAKERKAMIRLQDKMLESLESLVEEDLEKEHS